MAISHTGHLFAAALLFFALAAPLLRQSVAYDYTSSRQFRKNIAVSRHKNHTYWLPNYHWTPPEKYDGPRRKPAWEKEEESPQENKVKTEQQEWEEKMREISQKEREKWKSYKKDAESLSNDQEESKSSQESSQLEALEMKSISTEDSQEEESESSLSENNGILENSSGDHHLSESKMSYADKRNKTDKKIKEIGKQKGNGNVPRGNQGGANVKNPQKKIAKQNSAKAKAKEKNGSKNKRIGGKSQQLKDQLDDEGERRGMSMNFPANRWGMSRHSPPAEFLKNRERGTGYLMNQYAQEEKYLLPGVFYYSPANFDSSDNLKERYLMAKRFYGNPVNNFDSLRTEGFEDKYRAARRFQGSPENFMGELSSGLDINPGSKFIMSRRFHENHHDDFDSLGAERSFEDKYREARRSRQGKSGPKKGEKTSLEGEGRSSGGNETRSNSTTSAKSGRLGEEKKGEQPRENGKAKPKGHVRTERWGMSVPKAPAQFFEDLSKKRTSAERGASSLKNARWGMSVLKAPKKFLQEITEKLRKKMMPSEEESRDEDEEEYEEDSAETTEASESSTQKEANSTKSSEEEPREETREEGSEETKEDQRETSETKGRAEQGKEEKGNEQSKPFRGGRWGMSVNNPPQKFLSELSRRSNQPSAPKGNSRWGMSVAHPPNEFLKDVSRTNRTAASTHHRPTPDRTQENHKPIAKHQRKQCKKSHKKQPNSSEIARICQEILAVQQERESLKEAIERLRQKLGQSPEKRENLEPGQPYVYKGISLLLNLIRQKIDEKSKFLHAPAICRNQNVLASSHRV